MHCDIVNFWWFFFIFSSNVISVDDYYTWWYSTFVSILQNVSSTKGLTHCGLLTPYNIWWHRSGSTLARVMTCCLMAPSHYLNHYIVISEVQWQSWGQFHERNLSYHLIKLDWKLHISKYLSNLPETNESIKKKCNVILHPVNSINLELIFFLCGPQMGAFIRCANIICFLLDCQLLASTRHNRPTCFCLFSCAATLTLPSVNSLGNNFFCSRFHIWPPETTDCLPIILFYSRHHYV